MPSAYRFNFTTGEIRHSRRRVGSVRRDGDAGLYTARIGQHEFTARDATTAFREVAARAMGHASAAHLRAANAAIRSRNRATRAASMFSQRSRAVPAFREPLDAAALIARLQSGAVEMGETPLTEAEIRAAWRLGDAR
jgi:hypothetical protein